jgi:tRNA-Thr(GGU) m(6)t(6)A37 methyltransferase TsaA
MDLANGFAVVPIGRVHSVLTERSGAPRQGWEGAPDAGVEIDAPYLQALAGIQAGQEIWILTWLHRARRDVLRVHPRDDASKPLAGVFATRSPDRPNPIGLHRAKVLTVADGRWLQVQPLEAIDGTPIIDIKPVLDPARAY